MARSLTSDGAAGEDCAGYEKEAGGEMLGIRVGRELRRIHEGVDLPACRTSTRKTEGELSSPCSAIARATSGSRPAAALSRASSESTPFSKGAPAYSRRR